MRLKKRLLLPALLLAAVIVFLDGQYRPAVLMYHRVMDCSQADGAPCVSPEAFYRQMEFLKVHRYNVIGLEELGTLIRDKKRVPRNTVVITFDDGYLDNFEHAFPVLKQLELPAVVFMITNNIGKNGWLSEEDLKIMDAAGVTIGSHTVTHAFLPNVYRKEEMVRQIRESHEVLEKLLGRPITLFSYPAGGVTHEARDLVEEEGYRAAVTTNYGDLRDDPYIIRRVKVSNSDSNLFRFWAKVSGLYLIGKSMIPVR